MTAFDFLSAVVGFDSCSSFLNSSLFTSFCLLSLSTCFFKFLVFLFQLILYPWHFAETGSRIKEVRKRRRSEGKERAHVIDTEEGEE